MTYQWLFFDADNTLFDYARSEGEALRQVFEKNDLEYSPDVKERYARINQALWTQFEKGQVSSLALRVLRFEQLLGELDMAANAQSISDEYLRLLGNCAFLLPDAEMVIKSLKPAYRLALITNGISHVQRPRLAQSPLADCFEVLAISEEIGCAKPAPGYFDAVFERAGFPKRSEVLVIGDSLSSDIRGGNLYGVDTCWFNPQGKARDPQVTSRYEIRQLKELLDLLPV